MKRPAPRREDGDAKRPRFGRSSLFCMVSSRFRGEGEESVDSAPVLLPFRRWLMKQEDAITEEDASARYAAYKLEHKKQLIARFFTAHKDEEW